MDAENQTDSDSERSIRDDLKTVHGHETSDLDVADDDHPLADMDTKRQAPIEHVAENVARRYDEVPVFLREYVGNANTACVQSAKYKIRQAGRTDEVNMKSVKEVLEFASEEFDYEPVVTVEYNRNPDARWTLIIDDNGIGVSRQKAPAIRDIGLSGWHDDETTNGEFGQGTMSGFMPAGMHGEFWMATFAEESDEKYRVAWKLTDIDRLPPDHTLETRESYGTTFVWPTFVEEAQDMDVQKKLEEYVSGLAVPVIYKEYDHRGKLIEEEDYTPKSIEERYPEDSAKIVYEDQFGKAVWSPDNPTDGNGTMTWCGYQPIGRNDGKYGTNNSSFNMPSSFDIRVKTESGQIVEVDGSMDHPDVGKELVSNQKYDNLPEEKKEGRIPRSDMPTGEVIVSPVPTDDRDRFETQHVKDYMRRYSRKLEEQMKQNVGEVLDDCDGFEDIIELDHSKRNLLFKGIDEYLSLYSRRQDPDGMVEHVEEVLGATIDASFAKKIDGAQSNVSLVSRGASRPGKKHYREKMDAWKVVKKAGDGDVYMGQTITDWKAEVAWDLHDDNQVVHVDTKNYDKWEDIFGWKKLKDLPSWRKTLEEYGDVLSDDVKSTVKRRAPSSSGAGGSMSTSVQVTIDDAAKDLDFDVERAKQRYIKIRQAQRTSSRRKAGDVYEELEDGETTAYGADTVIAYRETDDYLADAGEHLANRGEGVAYTVVPNYVYDYLIRNDNVVTEDEYIEQYSEQEAEHVWHEDGDDSTQLPDLGERDLFVNINQGTIEQVEKYDVLDEFVEEIRERFVSENDIDSVRSVSFYTPSEFHHWMSSRSPTNDKGVVMNMDCGTDKPSLVNVDGSINSRQYYGYHSSRSRDILRDLIIPDEIDTTAPEMSSINWKISNEESIELLHDIVDAGGLPSEDPDFEIASPPREKESHFRMYSVKEKAIYLEELFSRLNDYWDDNEEVSDDGDN